jgi:hypothetical protein
MMRPKRLLAHRHRDRLAGIGDFLAACKALGGVHGDGAHRVLAQMLGHLEHQPLAVIVGLQRVQDRRQLVLEMHVDDGAGHLGDGAGRLVLGAGGFACHLACPREVAFRAPRRRK